MNDYLDSVREIERRIQQAESKNSSAPSLPAVDRPDGIPPTFEEHIQLMFDLMTLAFQTDLTRVVPNSRFGKATGDNVTAACTNPAALTGGSAELHAYLSIDGRTIVGTTPLKPWVVPEQHIDTPWVSVPGMLTARCTSNDNATYLEVTVHPDPSGHRTGDIVGDLGAPGPVLADWGLHLVDMNLAMGNLIDLVRQQSKASRSKN